MGAHMQQQMAIRIKRTVYGARLYQNGLDGYALVRR